MKDSFDSFYQNRSVFVTGHTGFKGGWLVTWLKMLGANITGFALPPRQDQPNLCQIAAIDHGITSIMGDIRDLTMLMAAFETAQPEVIFHLAAQPIVRRSYLNPLETIATNVMGTAHVLEAARQTPSVRVVVIITTDKCYENFEWVYAYRENDPMGGHDPYSASKGAAELVTAAYRRSFFPIERYEAHQVCLSSVRAGNVIGGGDWSEDRLISDCVKALTAEQPIRIRNPQAIRPWQHVLEPLAGYMWLAARMWNNPHFAGAWTFGPSAASNATVRYIVDRVLQCWGSGEWEDMSELQTDAPHEATFLKLDCTKAANLLNWSPILSLDQGIATTMAWYRTYYHTPTFDGHDFTMEQIKTYSKLAQETGVSWAVSNGN